MDKARPTGLTKDAGFQIGVRRTMAVGHAELWDFFFSPEGILLWFGNVNPPLPLGTSFKSDDGFEGFITTFREGSHFRMKWKKPGWDHFSMLQVRIMPSGNKTILAFHQDQLLNEQERMEMKAYWLQVAEKIEARCCTN